MNTTIYQTRVNVKNIKPPVWRRILIPSTSTFWELHIAIQDSFGWTDSHLHEFFIGQTWDKNAVCLGIPYPDQVLFEGEKAPLDESEVEIGKYLKGKQAKITYVYDFGDNWEHEIILEKILPFNRDAYPQVVDGRRSCPWEDSGGPYGYQDKIEILKNRKHKEFKEIADWIGIDNFSELDLESFDPKGVIFRNPVTELKRTQEGFENEFIDPTPTLNPITK